jgi:hypothetical protein
VVRVVHSLFASTDDWDDHLASFESGWPWFFRVLWLYLTHFRAQRCTPFRLMGVSSSAAPQAWAEFTEPLALADAEKGQRVTASSAPAPLAGIVERTGEGGHPQGIILRLDEPAPGIASFFGLSMGGRVHLVMDFYFYGEGAAHVAARDEPLWKSWLEERFPAAGAAAC